MAYLGRTPFNFRGTREALNNSMSLQRKPETMIYGYQNQLQICVFTPIVTFPLDGGRGR